MAYPRSIRFAPAILAVCLLGNPAAADQLKVIWRPTRTTSPDTIHELRALQESVKKVVDQGTRATVGLLVGSGARSGAGSGVIVSDDGLVLTAAHVIMDTVRGVPFTSVRVVLPDGSEVAAKSLGVNPKVDCGMVQITDRPPSGSNWTGAEYGKWPFVPLGKSADLKKGQWVVALGHPGGPKPNRPPAVRVGRYEQPNSQETSFQSDCPLVGGDSGGPLFDLNGKVVGIHSRIGISLKYNIHVPLEAFRSDWDRLVKGELIAPQGKPELGLRLDDSTEEARIAAVTPGGPAAVAGLKVGDVIVGFNDEKIHSADDVDQMVAACEPREVVTLEVIRGTATLTRKVTLGEKPRRK